MSQYFIDRPFTRIGSSMQLIFRQSASKFGNTRWSYIQHA